MQRNSQKRNNQKYRKKPSALFFLQNLYMCVVSQTICKSKRASGIVFFEGRQISFNWGVALFWGHIFKVRTDLIFLLK
jgi:hypothetical protein